MDGCPGLLASSACDNKRAALDRSMETTMTIITAHSVNLKNDAVVEEKTQSVIPSLMIKLNAVF